MIMYWRMRSVSFKRMGSSYSDLCPIFPYIELARRLYKLLQEEDSAFLLSTDTTMYLGLHKQCIRLLKSARELVCKI